MHSILIDRAGDARATADARRTAYSADDREHRTWSSPEHVPWSLGGRCETGEREALCLLNLGRRLPRRRGRAPLRAAPGSTARWRAPPGRTPSTL